MFNFLIVFILLGTIYANSVRDTTDNPMNKLEISTTSTQTFKDTTADQLLDNQTTSQFNVTSVLVTETAGNLIPNSTARNLAIQEKDATSTTTSSSDSGLSSGAIAGIIIGVILLLCCCGILGACGTTKGHWEDAKVWVSH